MPASPANRYALSGQPKRSGVGVACRITPWNEFPLTSWAFPSKGYDATSPFVGAPMAVALKTTELAPGKLVEATTVLIPGTPPRVSTALA
jgi:hypothetical protein